MRFRFWNLPVSFRKHERNRSRQDWLQMFGSSDQSTISGETV